MSDDKVNWRNQGVLPLIENLAIRVMRVMGDVTPPPGWFPDLADRSPRLAPSHHGNGLGRLYLEVQGRNILHAAITITTGHPPGFSLSRRCENVDYCGIQPFS